MQKIMPTTNTVQMGQIIRKLAIKMLCELKGRQEQLVIARIAQGYKDYAKRYEAICFDLACKTLDQQDAGCTFVKPGHWSAVMPNTNHFRIGTNGPQVCYWEPEPKDAA